MGINERITLGSGYECFYGFWLSWQPGAKITGFKENVIFFSLGGEDKSEAVENPVILFFTGVIPKVTITYICVGY